MPAEAASPPHSRPPYTSGVSMPRIRTERTPTPWIRTFSVSPSVTLTTVPQCRRTGPLLPDPSGSVSWSATGSASAWAASAGRRGAPGAPLPMHGHGLDSQTIRSPSASSRCGSPGPALEEERLGRRLRGEVAAVHVGRGRCRRRGRRQRPATSSANRTSEERNRRTCKCVAARGRGVWRTRDCVGCAPVTGR